MYIWRAPAARDPRDRDSGFATPKTSRSDSAGTSGLGRPLASISHYSIYISIYIYIYIYIYIHTYIHIYIYSMI